MANSKKRPERTPAEEWLSRNWRSPHWVAAMEGRRPTLEPERGPAVPGDPPERWGGWVTISPGHPRGVIKYPSGLVDEATIAGHAYAAHMSLGGSHRENRESRTAFMSALAHLCLDVGWLSTALSGRAVNATFALRPWPHAEVPTRTTFEDFCVETGLSVDIISHSLQPWAQEWIAPVHLPTGPQPPSSSNSAAATPTDGRSRASSVDPTISSRDLAPEVDALTNHAAGASATLPTSGPSMATLTIASGPAVAGETAAGGLPVDEMTAPMTVIDGLSAPVPVGAATPTIAAEGTAVASSITQPLVATAPTTVNEDEEMGDSTVLAP